MIMTEGSASPFFLALKAFPSRLSVYIPSHRVYQFWIAVECFTECLPEKPVKPRRRAYIYSRWACYQLFRIYRVCVLKYLFYFLFAHLQEAQFTDFFV